MKRLFLILAALLLVSCAKQDYVTISTSREMLKVNVEIARTQEEAEKGLMYRKSLGENDGMLFIFDDEETRTFWMKNTLIPLDMIFISKEGKIVDIKNAIPCKTMECPLYISDYPAKYVLEVNAGFAKRNNISMSDYIDVKNHQ